MSTTEQQNRWADISGVVNVELREPDAVKAAKRSDKSGSAQRNALDELVKLLTESTAIEQQIDQKRQGETESADREAAKAETAMAQRFQAKHDEVQQVFEQQVRDVEAKAEAELDEAGESTAGLRQRVELDAESAEHDVNQKLQQAEWLAESVYEGAMGQAAAEIKQTDEKISTQLEAIEAIDAQAFHYAKQYGQAALMQEPIDVPPPVSVTDSAQAEAIFEEHRQAAHAYLAELTTLGIPRLFIGVRYLLLVALLCILAGFIAQGIGGEIPTDGLAGFKLQTRAIFIGVGSTLAISVVGGIALWFTAKSQVRKAFLPLKRQSTMARQAAEVELKASKEHRDAIVARAKKKRELELAAARDRFSPMVNRAVQNRQAALQTVHGEAGSRLSRIEGQRDQVLIELEHRRRDAERQVQEELERELTALRRSHEERKRQSEQTHANDRAALLRNWEQGIGRIQAPIDNVREGQAAVPIDWNDAAWESWTPPKQFPSQVRIGQMRVDLKQIEGDLPGQTTLKLPGTFAVPALLAFPSPGSLLIQTDASGRKDAIRILQMAMARLLTSLPAGRVRFTIIDPIGLGQNFAGFMHLADHDEALVGPRIWTDSEQVEQRLKDLTEHMETVIQKYLRNEYKTIDEYNAQAGELAEPYRHLVVADLPHNFSPEALRRLNSIASTGARCGVYVLIMRDLREPLSGGHIDEVESHSVHLIRQDDRFIWKDEVFSRFPLELDPPPEEATLTKLLDIVGRHAKEAKRVEVPFEQIAPALDDGQMWSWDTSEELKVPIGRLGATRQQVLRLGKGVAQHALIAGKTGSGKSTLLHVL
ncbi:MAG: hypothetical protein H0T11_01665, partial [Chthoniobacterales bacterium]|nr:hypothetical protein [Chthoniobacterales bacterium]